jgi:lipoate-protein ligase A
MERLNLILSPFEFIQDNLTLEQFLMMGDENFLLLYRNHNCIVIGRNQVLYSEVALKELQTHDIPVFRRNSGGGAVFLDEGTLNYAFITNYNYSTSSYSYFNQIIIRALYKIGFRNIIEKGCNIYHGSSKISGTAQYKRKDRFIHHGTLLIDTNLQLMYNVFSQSKCYTTRAKRSDPVQTENLININPKPTLYDFERKIIHFLEKNYCYEKIVLSEEGFEYVKNRRKNFEDKLWTFGSSPKYKFFNEIFLPDGEKIKVTFEVNNGKVTKQYLSKNTSLSGADFIGYFHSYDDFFPLIFQKIGKNTSLNEVKNICYQFFNCEKRA